MSKKQFNPKQYQDKERVYSKNEKGISRCWTWDEAIKEYCFTYFECRKKGLLKKEDKKTFQDLKSAKNWLYQAEAKAIDIGGPKFSDIFNKWKTEHLPTLRTGTRTHYEKKFKCLTPLMHLPISTITPDKIDNWVINLKSGKMRETRLNFNKELIFLKGIFSFHREHSSQPFDIPARKRHFKKGFIKEKELVSKAISEAEFVIFRYELAKLENGLMYSVLATLQFYHSLRIGEAAGLAKADFALGAKPCENTLMIRRSVKWDRVKGAKPYIETNFKNSKDNVRKRASPQGNIHKRTSC